MATPTAIVAYSALFVAVAGLFLFVNLLVGRLVRPRLPNKEKLEVYECGEPVIGSSFVQFDLRFYVVALLFIIFDVEVAFFFPWATVYGKAVQLTSPDFPVVSQEVDPNQLTPLAVTRLQELGVVDPQLPVPIEKRIAELNVPPGESSGAVEVRETARKIAYTSFADIAVFFAVLMVGFAYVWRRGDLDWVHATSRQRGEVVERAPSRSPAADPHPTSSIMSS